MTGEARPGRDTGRIMPKDMAELDRGGTDLQVAAQRLVTKFSVENAARTSLWYVSRVVASCDINVDK